MQSDPAEGSQTVALARNYLLVYDQGAQVRWKRQAVSALCLSPLKPSLVIVFYVSEFP